MIFSFYFLVFGLGNDGSCCGCGIIHKVTHVQRALIILSIMFVAGAGNVINDIYDREIDKINKSDKVIVGKVLSLKFSWGLYFLLNFFAIFFSSMVSFQTGFVNGLYLAPLMVILLWLYSYKLKKSFLFGNFLVALLSASAIIIPTFFTSHNYSFLLKYQEANFYFFFAFIVSLIREIVKDLEDKIGDQEMGAKTLAVLLNKKYVKFVIYILLIILLFGLGGVGFELVDRNDSVFIIGYVFLMMIIVLVLIGKLWKAKTTQDFHSYSTLLKLKMLIGILSIPIVYFL